RVVVCGLSWALVTAAFFVGSAESRAAVQADLARRYPETRLVDTIVTPLPATPLCWSAIALHLDGADLVSTRVSVALLPGLIATDACTTDRLAWSTAPAHRLARGTQPM